MHKSKIKKTKTAKMKNLNLAEFNSVSELTWNEMSAIEGGTFWQDLAYVVGVAVHGLVVFATEGGQNAGISVR